MRLIDTHSHIYTEEFKEDISQVIQRAKEVGVEKIFLPTTDVPSIETMLELYATDTSFFVPFVGLYPGDVREDVEDQLSNFYTLLRDERIKGIGEIGLDFYWDRDYYEQQLFAFETQTRWSKENNDMPLSIHCRKAFEEIFTCFKHLNYPSYKGVFHCFGGDINQAKKVIEMGFLLGIGGVVTFKNAHLKEVVKQVDLQHIVLETDAPYLAPTPHRGQRNEPMFLKDIVQMIAEIKEISIEEVAQQTTQNALQLLDNQIIR